MKIKKKRRSAIARSQKSFFSKNIKSKFNEKAA